MKNAVIAALLLLLAVSSFAAEHAWLEYGPSGVIARAIVKGDRPCPSITIDGSSHTMKIRAQASKTYDVTSCEATLPAGARSASIAHHTLPVKKIGRAAKVAILGDTGCRRALGWSGGPPSIQNCADPVAWPWATVAKTIAAWDPDLVIQVGDYYYREAMKNAKGQWVAAPYDWPRWQADFFTPAQPLLSNAPWIFARGNHETCSRASEGFFRFLDPRLYSWESTKNFCKSNLDMTPPYTVTVGGHSFVVFDSSAVKDGAGDPKQIPAYQSQLELLAKTAPAGSWLVLHHPLWALEPTAPGTETLWTAWANASAKPPLSLIVAGHIHLSEMLDFTDGGVPQAVVGNGGTMLDKGAAGGSGSTIGPRTVKDFYLDDGFGFIAATPGTGGAWTFEVKGTTGATKATCEVTSGAIKCR